MKSRDFCYWLQGFFELNSSERDTSKITLNAYQVQMIRKHLGLVFKHEIDPSAGDISHQQVLNEIHNDHKPAVDGLVRC